MIKAIIMFSHFPPIIPGKLFKSWKLAHEYDAYYE